MMMFKALLLTGLLVAMAGQWTVEAAPKALQGDREFENKLAAFLAQDSEVQSVLEKVSAVERHRRETEMDAMNVDEIPPEDEGNDEPGFFDRAAKFVMDLLQRFLKWVNSDN